MVVYVMVLQNYEYLMISDIAASVTAVRTEVNNQVLQKDTENT